MNLTSIASLGQMSGGLVALAAVAARAVAACGRTRILKQGDNVLSYHAADAP